MLSRYEVEMEHYSKILNIEARTMLKIANKQLIPAATAYMGEGTVRNHISSILAKMGLRNRTQIAIAYLRG